MDASKNGQLQALVATIQRRWGTRALHKASSRSGAERAAAVPTGFTTMEQALGIDGIPRGRITELVGTPTCGAGTLALKACAAVQALGDSAVYLDMGHTFDPLYAADCGVTLPDLLLVRPHSTGEALGILHALVTSGGIGLLVLDSVNYLLQEADGAAKLSQALGRLAAPLANSPCALLLLSSLPPGVPPDRTPGGRALAHYAALRLHVRKEHWLRRRRDIVGYRVQVTTLKNKQGRTGGKATLKISL